MLSGTASQFAVHATEAETLVRVACRRHSVRGPDAEDFASLVRFKLLENDHAILRKFQGQSSLRTYLTVVITRLLLDHRIQQWGKWRPSAEAKRQGPVALQLERLLYRDHRTFEEAVHVLKDHPREELERLAALLPHRTPRRFEGEEKLEAVARPEPSPEREMVERERAAGARGAIRVMREGLAGLGAEDRLILRMRFEQGLSVVEIAQMLRLEAKPLYRRIERLLLGLRRVLEEAGVDKQETLAALGSVWMDADEGDDEAGEARKTRSGSVSTGSGGDGDAGREE